MNVRDVNMTVLLKISSYLELDMKYICNLSHLSSKIYMVFILSGSITTKIKVVNGFYKHKHFKRLNFKGNENKFVRLVFFFIETNVYKIMEKS